MFRNTVKTQATLAATCLAVLSGAGRPTGASCGLVASKGGVESCSQSGFRA